MSKIYSTVVKYLNQGTRIAALVGLAVFGFAKTSNAQEVTLTATAGPFLTGTFHTLREAFNAINTGKHNGNIVISINANVNEGTTPAVLNSGDADPANYNSVTIRPTADGLVVTGNPVAGFGVIELNGADNVIIDGDNAGTGGTNRNLTVNNTNTNTATGNSCIRVATSAVVLSADNITIKNCILNGNVTSGNASGITNTSSSSNISFGIYCGGNGGATVIGAPTAITSETTNPAVLGSTINNLIVDNNAITNCARAIAFNGAAALVSTGVTVTNNTIGTAGTLVTYPYDAGALASTVYTKGIWLAGTNALTVSGNTIRNILSYLNFSLTGIELASSIGTGTVSINNNNISGIVNNSTSGSNPVGIFINSVNSAYTIKSNVISQLENNAGFVFVAGIQIASPGAAGVISENKVSGLYARNTASGAGANGIYLSGAANGTVIQNNFVFDIRNAGKQFTLNNVNGILLASGSNHKIYHNSVNLYGVSGATASTSINCLGVTLGGRTGLDIRNNIFSNTVTGGTASDVHTCIFLPNNAINLTINNNAYYTGSVAGKSVIGFAGGTTYAAGTLFDVPNFDATVTTGTNNFRRLTSTLGNTANDNASIASTAPAPFVSATDLHLNTGATPTPLESGGAAVGVTIDIDAAARNLSTPDIGADEFVGVLIDNFAPSISLSLPASCTFVRTLNATITDATGVPTSGVGLPMLYWKLNGVAQPAVTATFVSADQYTFTFGGGIAGDVITYYVVAQDVVTPTPNVIAFPSTGAGGYTVNPPAAGTEPTTPLTYTNQPSLAGVYNVGPAGAYLTLTSAVAAYNASCIGGPVTFQLVAGYNAAYSAANETYPITINANSAASSVNTLTIKAASGIAAVIQGDNGSALIKFNGADYVIFDGTPAGGSSLTLNNLNIDNSASIFWIASASVTNGATNNTIKNCTIQGSGSSTCIAGVIAGDGATFGGAAIAANSNNTVSGNTMKGFQNGLYINGKVPGLDQNWLIADNIIGSTTLANDKMGFRGLSFQGSNNFTVSGNTINGVICGTTITSTASGISIFDNCSNGNIFNNKISDVKQLNTLGFGSNGIYLASSDLASNIKVYNNFIWDVSAFGFGGVLEEDNGYGIMVDAGGGYNIYYNSINMATNQTRTTSITAAINISSAITTLNTLNIRNNIFANTETVGTRYSIYSGAGATVYSNIDYNDYYYGTSTNLGFLSVARANLGAWQTATGKDAHSLAVIPSFNTAIDLHLQNTSLLNQKAVIGTGITTDIDGAARDAALPDIGADEFAGAVCVGNTPGTATAAPANLCGAGSTFISATGFSTGEGNAYQWQSASLLAGPYADIVGQTNPYSLNTGVLATTTYFRLGVKCGAGAFAYGAAVTVTVNNPSVVSSTGATRCGTGSVSLTATGSAGTQLNWYNVATGGSPLFTGSPFVTPAITASTNYYVSASVGGTTSTVGVPVTGNSCGTPAASSATDWPLRFNTTAPLTLVSAYCIPQAAGTFTVALRASLSNTDIQTATFTFTAGEVGSPKLLPLNFSIATPGAYQITNTVGGVYRLGSGTFTCSYPFTAGNFSIVGSATFSDVATSTTQYNSFYDLVVSEGCESARTLVAATVTAAPAISVPTATPATICAGQSSTLAVSSVNDPNYTYTWTPGPVVGSSVSVSPATTTTYTVNAVDNTAGPNAGCAANATVTVNVNALPGAVTVTPHTPAPICAGSTVNISATGGTFNGTANFTSGVISQTIPDANTLGTSHTLNVTGIPAGATIDSVIVTANINFASFDADIIMSLEAPNGQVLNLVSGQSIPPFGGTNFTNTRISSDNTKPAINSSTAPFTGTFKADAATTYELTPTPLQTTTLYSALFTVPNGNWIFHAYDDEAIGTGTLVNWQIKIAYTANATFAWTPNNGTLNTLTGPAVIATPLATTTYYATATNAAGCTRVDSSVVTVNSASASVTIAANPGNVICAGTSVTFTATPVNPGPGATYDWYVGAGLVQSGASLTYTTAALANGQVVTCKLTSNAACVVGNPFTSNAITMTVNPNLPASITIAANPGNVICAGTSVTFTATPVNPGAGPIYQWFVGATLVQTGGLTYTTNTLTNGQVVTCVLTSNALCVTGSPATSNAITMTVNPNLPASITIVASPAGPICAGTSVTFTATPVNPGAGPIYQWYVGATLVQTGGLTYTTTALLNGDIVTCVLTSNALCATGSPATSNAITMTVNGALIPSVTISPSPTASACVGSTITFTATPVNGGTPSYQWLLGGSPIPLATSNVYTYVPANGDQISVSMTSSLSCASPSTAVSPVTTVTVNPKPVTAPTATCLSLMLGNNSTLNANATTALGTITNYLWFLGAVSTGVNTATNTVTATGSYTVEVTNSFGCKDTSTAIVITANTSPLIGAYTINPVGTGCNNFTSIANAVTYANLHGLAVGAATVSFDVPAGYTETAPAGGISLGSGTLNASISAGKALVFQKSGAGANPKVTAFNPQSAGLLYDAVIKIVGTDYVTFDGIDVAENPLNTTTAAGTNNMTEFGYGIFYASPTDGAQNNTIKNCGISMSLTNPNSFGIYSSSQHAANTPFTHTDISAATGDNSNLKIYGNSISNVNNPIVIVGAPAFPGSGLDIGGSSAATANTITSFGSTSTFSGFTGVPTNVNGISATNEFACNISYNSITSSNGGLADGTLRGIYVVVNGGIVYPGSGSFNSTLNNNSISLKTGVAAGLTEGISNTIGNATLNLSISNNDFNNFTNTAGTPSGIVSFIVNTAPVLSQAFNSNTFTNLTLNTTGNVTFISNNVALPAGGTQNVNDNRIVTAFNKTGVGGTILFYTASTASNATAVINNNNNNFSNMTSTGSPVSGWVNTDAGPGVANKTISGNTFSNITNTGAGAMVIMNVSGSTTKLNKISTINSGSSITGIQSTTTAVMFKDTVTNLTATGNCLGILINTGSTIASVDSSLISSLSSSGNTNAVSGIQITASTGLTITNDSIASLTSTGTTTPQTYGIQVLAVSAAAPVTFSGNIIKALSSNGTSNNTIMAGISSSGGGTVNIFKNKIYNLSQQGAINFATAVTIAHVTGISLTGGTTVTAHNNFISDLRAPNVVQSTVDVIRGISVTSGSANSNYNLYYNTVYLNASNVGTNPGTSGIFHTGSATATTAVLTMKDNLISNESTLSGSGKTVAFRRGTTNLVNYAAASNNNAFYAGTPGANNLIFYDGTAPNSYQTLSTYQAFVGPTRDALSVTAQPSFVNAAIGDLHLNPTGNCEFDGNGAPIVITDDIDLVPNVRNATMPDIGADEFDGSGGSGTWKGVNTNWMDPQNWCGAIPTASTNVVIPSGKNNYPIIVAAGAVTNNITIASGGSVIITGVGKLDINGSISNAGTFNVTDGTIEMQGSAAQTIPAGAFLNNDIKNLVINNSAASPGVTLGGALKLYGKLSMTGNNRTFTTAGFLTLKSTATGTASVGDISNNNTTNNNQITGDVSVERFITAKRAWRFLSVPTQNNLQNIHQAWQENQAANASGTPGFGTQITSNIAGWAAAGFDMQSPGGPSIKTYVPATNTWAGVPSLNGAGDKFVTGQGYMVFVRGDRTIITFGPPPNTTVLRDKGALNTYTFNTPPIPSGQFTAVGNPYASAVDFSKLTKSNIQDIYYMWDPKLGTFGGYQTFVGPGPVYSVTPGGPGASYDPNYYIESGQAFFVHNTSGSAGSLSFSESSKVDGSNLVARPMGTGKQLRTNVYVVANGESTLFDGVLSQFDAGYSNTIDELDAIKLSNFNENLSISRSGNNMSVERRTEIADADTIFYNLGQVGLKHYQFEFIPADMNQPGLTGYLEDSYLHTSTPISMETATTVDFDVINDAGSYAADRFRLVFKQSGTVPVTFNSVRANKKNSDILVEWKVDNELNIHHYEVEKSSDGQHFTKVNEQAAHQNNGGTASYSWLDTNPFAGDNFYRIKSVGIANDMRLSQQVKVNMQKLPSDIKVFPNPVPEDGVLYVNLENKPAGVYLVKLINSEGQTVFSKALNHAGGNSVYTIAEKHVAHGNYLMRIINENNVNLAFKIVY